MSSRQFIKWRAILSSFMLMFVTSLSFIPSASAQGETYTYVTPTDIRAEGGVLSTPAKLVPDPAGLSNAFGGASTFSGGITYPGVPRAKDSTLAGVVCNTTLTITPNGGSGTADSTTGADVQPGGTNQRNGNLCPAPGISTSISIGKANLYGPGGACVPTGTDQVVGPQCAAQGGVALQPDPQNKGQYINPGADGTGGTATGDVTATCEGGALTWIVCPLIAIVQKGISILSGWVQAALVVTPLNTNSDDGLYKAWSAMRNLADVFFILIFFVVIFGTGLGLDNYSVKKILPRLMAAAILVQFSYILCGVAIDIANVLGLGLSQLIAAGVGTQATAGNSVTKQVLGSIEGLALLGGSAALAVSVGAIVPVGLAVLSAILSLLAAFVTLEVRVLLINFLVVISPFAFVLWVLPNTAKYFKEWWEFFSKLLIMFPIIMLLLTVANLLSVVAQSAGANLDILQQILAAVVPIIVFFLIPATFKLAGSALNLGHNMVTKASGGTHKGLSGMAWGKDQQEARRAKGLAKFDELQRLGKGNSMKGRLAQMQGGFGLGKAKGPKANRLESSLNKAMDEKAQAEALKESREKLGTQSYEQSLGSRRTSAFNKIMEGRVAEAGNGGIAFKEYARDPITKKALTDANGNKIQTDVTVAGKMSNIDLSEEAVDHLTKVIHSSVDNGEYATTVAAMQSLGRSAGGRQRLSELKASVFGGTDTSTVNPNNLGGQAKSVYDMGVSKISGDAAPDLVKPTGTAFSGVSGAELAAMDTRTKARYMDYAINNKMADQASTAIKQIMDSPQLRTKVSKDDYKKMYDVLEKNGNTKPNSKEKDVFSTALNHEAAAVIVHGAGEAKNDTPPATWLPGYTPPAQPTAQAQPTVNVNVQPAQPTFTTAPRAGTVFQQPAPGALYVPGSYRPPITNPHPPKVDPAVEEHIDDHIGDDRSIS